MASELKCPYCDEHQSDDPEECYEEDKNYEHECEHCEKNFVFSPYYIRGYSESKADCLNGAEHDWQEINGYPKEYFENKRRCSMCSEEKVIK